MVLKIIDEKINGAFSLKVMMGKLARALCQPTSILKGMRTQ